MTEYKVYANCNFWGIWEARTPEEAIQIAADEVGTIDVGEKHASTERMLAILVEE